MALRASTRTAATGSSSSVRMASTAILPLRTLPSGSTQLYCYAQFSLQRRNKSKRSSAQYIDPNAADDDDVPVMKTKGKGSKSNRGSTSSPRGAKSKRGDAEQHSESEFKTLTRNQDLPDEAFDFTAISSHMSRAVERCKSTTSTLVGSVGRADPSLLDSIKVEFPGTGTSSKSLHPLREFATVGVRDGALMVTAYDADMVKHIERAIYSANLGLTPQTQASQNPGDENIIRVAIPQPTTESRQAMVKDLTKICENARVSIRDARHKAQKQIKSDIDAKVVGKNEGEKETKKVEAETKKWSAEVEKLFEKMKQTLLAA
ncbi:uncharacterized protein MEPE_00094 [Melanopsichium pennsylvanicum]|uniref:Ribosome recycling factor domain-containing protein n=2 Tax=Melanopsichium pennsylvanicum TaxID=63383 RepID=A0AAJ5C2G2_9BASI|nr:ribosome recycling factor [Melanopsichium pennsylvanicum 4]SNX81389.1 uncharacterized protein MEPE_00094 [Melanopsichium pennsylvanicum]